MNAERLQAIAVAVLNDLNSTKTVESLDQLTRALQNMVNQPQAAQHQQQVSGHLEELYKALSSAPSNSFSPGWKQGLKELGLHDLLGTTLQTQIQDIFAQNQITPSVALEKLQALRNQLSQYKTALEQIIAGFRLLHIGDDELKPGQCEIGILVPRSAVHNKLDEFVKDLGEIDGVFETFAELTTGKRSGFQIRSMSSSDLSVFLDVLPIVAFSLAVAVERILAVYKNILEIRKLHNDLQTQGVPKKQLKGVLEHANSLMKTEIEKLIKDLLKEYYKVKDSNRQNELAIGLRFSLDKIANRIDRGYSVEIRVQPLPEDEVAKSKVKLEDRQYIEKISSISENMEFLKLEGSSILTLPESSNSGEE
jgi:hypothetical protein